MATEVMVVYCFKTGSEYKIPLQPWRNSDGRIAFCPGCGGKMILTMPPCERVDDVIKPRHMRLRTEIDYVK